MSDLTDDIDKYLTEIYYNPESPASYYGVSKLWQYVKNKNDRPEKLTFSKIKHWLRMQDVHIMHKTSSKRIKTQRMIFSHLDEQWAADIVYIGYPKDNQGNQYLLTILDCFSRFLFVKVLKSKSASATAKAFKEVLALGRHPEVLQTDQGGEFTGNAFQEVIKEYDIWHLLAYGPHKAALVERVNKTIENRLYKYFYEKQTHNFVSVIDSIVASYNATIHGFIGMPPEAVNAQNSHELYDKVYIPILVKWSHEKVTQSFAKGDLVRLTRAQKPFARGFTPKLTEEIFRVINVILSHPPRYKVADLNNSIIQGSFYTEELRKINIQDPDKIVYKIEKVLKTKKVKGKNYSYVSWLGYDKSFRTWISTSEIKAYKGKI